MKSSYFILLLIFIVACKKEDIYNSNDSNIFKFKYKIGVSYESNDFTDNIVSFIKERYDFIHDNINDKIGLELKPTEEGDQLKDIDYFINNNFDIVLIYLNSEKDSSLIIQKLINHNIPAVFFHMQISDQDIKLWNKIFYVGIKLEQPAILQGQLVKEYWDFIGNNVDKNKNGRLDYIMLTGKPNSDSFFRTKYPIIYLNNHKIKTKLLELSYSEWEKDIAANNMKKVIEKYGDEIEFVIANNDNMALGAIDALKEYGYFKNDKYMPVIGVDATSDAIKSIKKGEMYATIQYDFRKVGTNTFNIAYALLENKNITDYIKKDGSEGTFKNNKNIIDYKIIKGLTKQ